jgi:hypothetical protein
MKHTFGMISVISVLGLTTSTVNAAILSIEDASAFDLLDPAGTLIASVPIVGFNGIDTDRVQPADPSNPDIDEAWPFFGQEGVHISTSPASIYYLGGSLFELDFSGWGLFLFGEEVSLGAGAWGSNPEGIAVGTCAGDCSDGDSYTLEYTATIQNALFPNFLYSLALTGIVSDVVVPPEPGSIYGAKYHDLNKNGAVDPTEPGLPGWEILLSVGDTLVNSMLTDADGNYGFTGLEPDTTYTVSETLQEGWEAISPLSGTQNVFVVSGETVVDVNFLNAEISGPPLPVPSTVALLGLGIAGLGFSRKKKHL